MSISDNELDEFALEEQYDGGRISALLCTDRAGMLSIPNNEEDLRVIDVLFGPSLNNRELTAAILILKDNSMFRKMYWVRPHGLGIILKDEYTIGDVLVGLQTCLVKIGREIDFIRESTKARSDRYRTAVEKTTAAKSYKSGNSEFCNAASRQPLPIDD